MKLLQLNVTANWGSTGKVTEGIGQAAIARGWESTIAYGRNMNSSQSRLIKVGNQLDVYAHYAQHRLFDCEGLGSKRPTRSLINWIDGYEPDIIHLHNIHDHWLNYPLLFQYLATINTPIVWTFHDCWAFTGGCAYFENPQCSKWEMECHDCPNRKSKIDRSAKQFKLRQSIIASMADRITIVPVSNWLTNFCSHSMLKEFRTVTIHNGVDLTKFRIRGTKAPKPMILGVAMVWDARKGLDDFIKLRELIPYDIADITLVGLDNQQIKLLPIGIKGISKTQNVEELIKLYNEAWVLVNPTYADNFPTTNIEALACGTPIITYRTGGSPEAVDEKTGIIIEKGNIQAIADGVMKIISCNHNFCESNCRERAEEYYNQKNQFNKYIDLYQNLLKI